jgi:hypothetical protein
MNIPSHKEPQISQGVHCPGGIHLYLGRANQPVKSLNSPNLPLLSILWKSRGLDPYLVPV